MEKLNRKFIAGLMIVALFASTSLFAQQRQERQRGDEQRMEQRAHRGQRPQKPRIPNLTEEQEEQLKTFKVAHEKETLPLKNQLNEAEAHFQTLTTADEINKKEVGRVIETIADLKAELMMKRVDHMEEVKSILTEEQKVALNNQLVKEPGRRKSRRR